MPRFANHAFSPSGTMNTGEPPDCAGQRLHAGVVEVVVVVVRDHDASTCGRSASAMPGLDVALRPEEGERRRALRKDRVGQESCAAGLHEHRRMADPGDRGLHRETGRSVAAQVREIGRHHRCRRPRRLRQTVAQRIGAPLQQRAEPLRLEVDVVVLEPAVAVMARCGRVGRGSACLIARSSRPARCRARRATERGASRR
jgi:hypothetical protein